MRKRSWPVSIGVMSIPTVYIFKDGEPVNRIVGAVPKEKILVQLNAVK